ncbi:hypothetical protein NEOLEDRAFT_324178 [Neolentinus lepideus HHB14362 ss-1]|uniref:Uncharacterized protein n=1 Tax=Neolentinus lepideus HHB14362 ss-1 TaxID=1314782 RepID=A0A165VWG6_9AGAM|nr:hypothetical protein NEOLEDRAFT_324178 [Neolentinus lepideus HHB14362 ss-1]
MKEWSSPAIDEWLRRLLPLPFNYLDARYGFPEEGQYHWRLLSRSRSIVDVVERPGDITGRDMFMVRGGPGKNHDDYVVHFCSAKRIPRSVYTDWLAAIARAEEGLPEIIKKGEDTGEPTTDEDASMTDSENEGFTGLASSRPKPRPAYRGAARAKADVKGKGRVYQASSSDSEGSSDDVEDDGDANTSKGDDENGGSDAGEIDWHEDVGDEQVGMRRSGRLLGKRKRLAQPKSDGEFGVGSDIEFVAGPSSTNASLPTLDGSEANPFNVDDTELPLFLTSDLIEPMQASSSGWSSAALNAKPAVGLKSPGKPSTNPWLKK